jgi:adenylylsulfate kinase
VTTNPETTTAETRNAVTTNPETTTAVTTTAETPRSATPAAGGGTVWLTGLPSAGKSTIARAVAERLRAAGRRVEVLDGDEIRAHLTAGLGFSRADRDANVSRIGWLARLLARNGVLVLVPVIAPYEQARSAVREAHAAEGVPYWEVHVATPVAECAKRDVKGLYAAQARGEISALTGVDDPYEEPAAPQLRLPAGDWPLAECVSAVLALVDAADVAPARAADRSSDLVVAMEAG